MRINVHFLNRFKVDDLKILNTAEGMMIIPRGYSGFLIEGKYK